MCCTSICMYHITCTYDGICICMMTSHQEQMRSSTSRCGTGLGIQLSQAAVQLNLKHAPAIRMSARLPEASRAAEQSKPSAPAMAGIKYIQYSRMGKASSQVSAGIMQRIFSDPGSFHQGIWHYPLPAAHITCTPQI